MRTTTILYARHIGRAIKERWFYQGRLKLERCNAKTVLAKNNIRVYKVGELDEKQTFENVKTNPLVPDEIPFDENHPDWKAEPCYIYKDNDVLVEGINQARIITNSLLIEQLPPALIKAEEKVNLPDEIHEEAKKRIKQSCIFDAYQELLPKRYLPDRPGFNLRREYGITTARKCKLLLYNLVEICDQLSGSFDKRIMCDGSFVVPMKVLDKTVQFELSAEVLLSSDKKLLSIENSDDFEKLPINDIYPLDCTLSLKKYHFYNIADFFPIYYSEHSYLHTIFFGHDRTTVKNLYEEEVTEDQVFGRTHLKLFTAAASQARTLFGAHNQDLIYPVVVQGVMTDGKHFQFSVIQLNSMNTAPNNLLKNLYWTTPPIPLYETCDYVNGAPTLTGYNPEVLRKIMAFYNST